MIEKPLFGSPCNGCGQCCREELCQIAGAVFPEADAPCPAIRKDGERTICGLIQAPGDYAPVLTSIYGAENMRHAARTLLGVDKGCDAEADDEIAGENAIKEMDAKYAKVHRLSVLASMMVWRIGV